MQAYMEAYMHICWHICMDAAISGGIEIKSCVSFYILYQFGLKTKSAATCDINNPRPLAVFGWVGGVMDRSPYRDLSSALCYFGSSHCQRAVSGPENCACILALRSQHLAAVRCKWERLISGGVDEKESCCSSHRGGPQPP